MIVNANKETKTKVLIILGPTASGKSDLAVSLSLKFNGEVISADSRQVYRGLDIGTGKITKGEMKGVPHHLLDIAEANERISVVQWRKIAEQIIGEIISRHKLPIVCGGTGYYISSLVQNTPFPEVPIDIERQRELEGETTEELFNKLNLLDTIRARSMTENGENKNKRRLARAIIIAEALGKIPRNTDINKNTDRDFSKTSTNVQYIKCGIDIDNESLKQRIRSRLSSRIENGMIKEAQNLHDHGLSFERMDELGLEYRYLAKLLKGEIDQKEMFELLNTKIWQYAKRQKTWWKREKDIHWIPFEQIGNAVEIISKYLY